jgi:hypothetical protein
MCSTTVLAGTVMPVATELELELRCENLRIDTEYKRAMLKWEPWKAMAVVAGASATITLALVGIATAILSFLLHR